MFEGTLEPLQGTATATNSAAFSELLGRMPCVAVRHDYCAAWLAFILLPLG
jgi:hypothetical protein